MADMENRIRELEAEIQSLKDVRKTLRHNFHGMVQLLVETISLSDRYLGGHLKRTSEMAKAFREKQKLSKDLIFLGYYAGLLHDIGLVGESSIIIEKKMEDMTPEEKIKYQHHPILGYKILNSIYNLKRIAVGIRAHHENYDGTGFPDKLAGKEIPEEARLIHIIDDYDIYRFKYNISPEKTLEKMIKNTGKSYDPVLINQFESFIKHYCQKTKGSAKTIRREDLEPGMYLDEDIVLSNGVLLTPRGTVLDELTLSKIKSFSSMLRENNTYRVIF